MVNKGGKMNIDQAIKIAKQECKDPYAQAYLKAIPESIELGGSDAFQVQLLYAQCNMASWRGEQAREVKKVIRAYLKEKGRM